MHLRNDITQRRQLQCQFKRTTHADNLTSRHSWDELPTKKQNQVKIQDCTHYHYHPGCQCAHSSHQVRQLNVHKGVEEFLHLDTCSSRSLAAQVYLCLVLLRSVLTYDAETWTLLADDLRRRYFYSFFMKCLRQLLHVSWWAGLAISHSSQLSRRHLSFIVRSRRYVSLKYRPTQLYAWY